MAKQKRRTSAITYARRLTEDDYVQGQLREAAASIRRAVLALQHKQPEPKHRGRKLALVALAGGGAAVAPRERRRPQIAALVPSGSESTAKGG